MAQAVARPPDLDAQGQPVGGGRPPDLDASGKAIAAATEPDWIDKLTSWLPAAGATAGGVVGTAGGPVGTIGGATLGGAAGEAYKELIARARGKAAPALDANGMTSSAAMKPIAEEGGIQGAMQGVGEGLGALAKPLGARLMQSAVKPGLKYLLKGADKDVQPVVQTLLDEGVNVTSGGIQKLKTLIGATNDEIKAAIAPVADKPSSALRSTRYLSDLAKRYTEQVNPQPDLESISAVGQNFLEHPAIASQGTLTIGQKQALKQGTYARIGEKYGTERAAGLEAEKQIARGLKDDVAAEVPAVSALNQREGKLLEALDAAGRRVALAGNKDPVGFAWAAHNPTTFLAALIDRSPLVKSLLARGLYNHAAQIAQVAPATIRVALHAIASGDPQAASVSASTDPGAP